MTSRMTPGMTRALVAVAIVAGARTAAADVVQVKVIDVAGGLAYVTPGRAAGIVPGAKLRLGRVELVVTEVTEKTAVVRLGKQRIAIGDAGTAEVTPGAATAARALPAPRAPEAFVGQWPDPVLPATTQDPDPVTLGAGRPPGRAHVAVIGRAFGVASPDDVAGDAEGRVIASFDVLTERPLAVDVDLAGRVFTDGYNKQTRTPVFARAAQLRYGDAADPRFALGRLRYAASAIGMLDGGRAAVRIGDVQVGAFGGLVPDPLSGKPDTSAARFGGEVVYDAATAAWQPRLAVSAHGSTWDGEVDERRLSLVGSASHDAWWFDGWAEAQAFSSDNPWGASAVELTGAGATAQWRKRGRHLGVDLNFQRPERSLRLAAALPPEWLCTLTFETGDTSTTCEGGDWWASATTSAGIRTGRWAVDAIGSVGRSHGQYVGLDSSGYVRGEVRLGPGRLQAAVSGGKASFASWTAGELGGGFAPSRRLDVAARYRPELLDYVASTGPVLLHSIVADGRYAVSSALDLALSAIGTTGEDRDALAILAIIAWRPLP